MADPTTALGGLGGQFWSTVLGAIIGAVASGAVSWGLQTSAARATREAERALRDERREVGEALRSEQLLEKRQRDLSLAHSITFKLIAMLSALAQIDAVAKDANVRIGLIKGPNSWLLVTPIGNKFPQQTLERDEQSFVASLKISGLTGKVAESFYLYNDFMFLIDSYRTQRFDVLNRIAAGRVGKLNRGSEPIPAELMTYEPLIIPVRQLAEAILERAPLELSSIQRSLAGLTMECERQFGDDFGKLTDVRAPTALRS